QVVASQHQDCPRSCAVFFCPCLCGHGRCEHLATGRAPELLQRITHRRQQRMAIETDLDAWLDPIQAPTTTPGATLAYRQGLMTADHVLGSTIGLGALASMAGAPLATRRRPL